MKAFMFACPKPMVKRKFLARNVAGLILIVVSACFVEASDDETNTNVGGSSASTNTSSDLGSNTDTLPTNTDATTTSTETDTTTDPGGGVGHITYTYQYQVFRIAAMAGAVPENITALLGESTGDRRIVQSPNGAWLTFLSKRFDCVDECLIRYSADLTIGEVVRPAGQDIYVEGISAITSDGATIVYASQGGPNQVDLFATTNDGTGWSAPHLLTSESTYGWNNMPSLSVDESAVYFDCGTEPYPESGTNDACRVNLDGSSFARVIGADALDGAASNRVQNPHEGPAGVYVEGVWPLSENDTPEIIWLLGSDGVPSPVGAAYRNSVSPCALPDGRWVMLWLEGPNNNDGFHELTLVDGDQATVLTPGYDIDDVGISCGL
jgi:hypothetical protein